MKKVCIVGGGPSGVFCAIKILELNPNINITIYEKGKILSTLLQTGNGRCNLAYNESDYRLLASNYPRGEKFLYSIFSRYGLKETMEDFNKFGIKTYIQEDGRIFPKSNLASEIREKFLRKISMVNIVKENIENLPLDFDAYVIATGLKFGCALAKNIGHTIVSIKPSLYGLNIQEKFNLEGVSFNNVLFTKNGVSGPFIYKMTSYRAYDAFPYEFKIPLIDPMKLILAVKNNPKKMFKTVVSDFIPKSLAFELIKNEKQCANITKKEIMDLEFLTLHALSPDSKGEIVHAGGVSLDEVDKNLKSKIKDNLWIIGELLNIDGLTGGFNLQNCWATAAISASDIVKKLS